MIIFGQSYNILKTKPRRNTKNVSAILCVTDTLNAWNVHTLDSLVKSFMLQIT